MSTRSLRYYEAKHLLHASRQENRYRDYDEDAVKRVHTIQFYLSLGLTTEQLFTMVGCQNPTALLASSFDYHNHTCPEAVTLYEHKLTEIETQIATLEEARGQLQKILERLRSVVQLPDT